MNPLVDHPRLREAWWQYALGHTGEARRLAKRLLEDARRRGDVAEVGVTDTLLGMVARDDLDFATANAHLERAVSTLSAALGEDHLDALHARAQRLGLFHEERRVDEARREGAALRAAAPPLVRPIDRRLVHLYVAAAFDEDDAADRTRETLRRIEAVLAVFEGDELPDARATVLLHAGMTHQRLGEHARAVERCGECVRLRTRALGEGAPRVTMARFSLAGALAAAGQKAKALAEAQSAMAAARRLGIERTPRMANGWATLGLASLLCDQLGGASEALERAVAIEEKHFGATHRATARLGGMLAIVHAAQGNVGRVAELLGRVMPTLLDANEEGVAALVEAWLAALTATGRHRLASRWSAEQLRQREGRLAPAAVASMEWAVAQGHVLDGDPSAALAPLERAIRAAREAHGPEGALAREYEYHLRMLRSGARPVRRALA